MDRFDEMSIFVKVVDENSFSAAARALEMTPSAVSKTIARLENRLGVRLFNRTTRAVSPTEEGLGFYAQCKQILEATANAELSVTRASQRPRGTLRVTATMLFGQHQLVPLLPAFLERHPDLTVNLRLTDRRVDMVESGIDVGIRLGPLSDSSIVARQIATTRRIVVAAPAYLQRRGTPVSPADLVQHNCLVMNGRGLYDDWTVEGPDGLERVKVRGNFVADNSIAVYSAALAGLGIARPTLYLVDADIKAGRLVALFGAQGGPPTPINVIYSHRRNQPAKINAFVKFLTEHYAKSPLNHD
ncbi:MAG: LysR family transcriptional regulator [Gammaproteobacteria bacterium]